MMRRTTTRLSFCIVVIFIAGCASTNLLSSNKDITKAKASAPTSAASAIGSPEFAAAQKVKDPIKIQLAYAGWHEQSGNYQEARKAYLKVLDKRPKETEAMLGLARIDQAYGRDAEADAQLKKTLKLHPKDPRVLVAIGLVHASREEWPEALEKMQAAHKLDPYDTIYEYHLAVIEARTGDVSSAVEHFTRSVGQAEAHFNVGYILNEQGRVAEAESHLMKALKLKPDLKQAETTLASIRTGKSEDVQPVSYRPKTRP